MINEKLKKEIEESIDKFGLEITEKTIQKTLNPTQDKKYTLECMNCEKTLRTDFSSIINPLLLKCDSCRSDHIFFTGKCRTSRKRGPEYRKVISIRYFNKIDQEFLFEFGTRDFAIMNKFEIKSRDNFFVLISKNKEEDIGQLSVYLRNLTTGRDYIFKKSYINDLNEQFYGISLD